MGLAVVHGIVKNHEGAVLVAMNPTREPWLPYISLQLMKVQYLKPLSKNTYRLASGEAGRGSPK